jgi:hypothetical protein
MIVEFTKRNSIGVNGYGINLTNMTALANMSPKPNSEYAMRRTRTEFMILVVFRKIPTRLFENMDDRVGFAKFIAHTVKTSHANVEDAIRMWDALPKHGRSHYEDESMMRNLRTENGRVSYERYRTIIMNRIAKVRKYTNADYTEVILSKNSYEGLSFEGYVNTLGSRVTGYTSPFQLFLEEYYLKTNDEKIVHSENEVRAIVNEWNALPEFGRAEWSDV